MTVKQTVNTYRSDKSFIISGNLKRWQKSKFGALKNDFPVQQVVDMRVHGLHGRLGDIHVG